MSDPSMIHAARQLATLADAEGTIPANVQLVDAPEPKGR